MFEVKRYTHELKGAWNQFLLTAKNSTFLFDRNYMDYHSDRFEDYSLMVYRKGALYAMLPANRREDTVFSHQGLTYGGLIMNKKATTSEILDVFAKINEFLKDEGVNHVVYKPTPYIYHQVPAQEDLYALFRLVDARIVGRNISSTIYQSEKIKFIESRKSGIRKALNSGVAVEGSSDFASFWTILGNNLKNKYGVKPVHSLEEITLLANRFPDNIHLFLARSANGTALGGTVIFVTGKQVVHTQYISASPEGKECGALDLLFDRLINEEYKDYPIFDFGQSTEDQGRVLNESLIFQKEGFGGRGALYDIYEYYL